MKYMHALFLLSILCGQHISNSNGQVFAVGYSPRPRHEVVFVLVLVLVFHIYFLLCWREMNSHKLKSNV